MARSTAGLVVALFLSVAFPRAQGVKQDVKPDVKPDAPTGCPMMDDKMMGGQMMGGQMAPQTGAAGQDGAAMGMGAGGMAQGKMMMDGKDMHCMHAAPAGSSETPSTPKPAPK